MNYNEAPSQNGRENNSSIFASGDSVNLRNVEFIYIKPNSFTFKNLARSKNG